MEALVIALIRVAGSLPVLRWAFVGGLIAVFIDLSDLFLRQAIDLGGLSNYQEWDKWVDQVYIWLFLIVALRWGGWERRVALGLFAWRLIGFIAFTGRRRSGHPDLLPAHIRVLVPVRRGAAALAGAAETGLGGGGGRDARAAQRG